MSNSFSRAMLVRNEIARLDLPHRKGFKLSEGNGKPPTLEHFDGEVQELKDALAEGDLEHAKEELADVFACLLQTATRLGMTFQDLDLEAERKLRLRFLGASEIPT